MKKSKNIIVSLEILVVTLHIDVHKSKGGPKIALLYLSETITSTSLRKTSRMREHE